MTPETLLTLVGLATPFVGVIVWLVRLEGRVVSTANLVQLVKDQQSTMAGFATSLAVIQTQIVHLQAGSESVHVILERLAGIEGQLKAFGAILQHDPLTSD